MITPMNGSKRVGTKALLFAIANIFCSTLYGVGAQATERDELIWYARPASKWTEAIPMGNGYLGAMVFGGVASEHFQLNESTLYSGDPRHTFNAIDVRRNFQAVSSLLDDGKFKEAERLVANEWLGRNYQSYQPLGDLFIAFKHNGEYKDYKRSLDLASAVTTVAYRVGETRFKREYFISNPDRVMVIRLTAEGGDKINCSLELSSPHKQTLVWKTNDNRIELKGKAPGFVLRREFAQVERLGDQYKYPEVYDKEGKLKPNASRVLYDKDIGGLGMPFEIQLAAQSTDGRIILSDNKLVIRGASEAVLVLTAATGYNGFDKSPVYEGVDPHERATSALTNVASVNYQRLLANHLHDYQSLFSRVAIRLGNSSAQSALPTDQRLASYSNGKDPSFAALYFQFGRYLMIAGSRQNGQPLNLQGMWNDRVIPPWNGAYTMNINLQMNYWPAEVTNLAECQEPFFNAINELRENGAKTAKTMYGNEGWVVHHNTDIWRHTEPADYCKCAFWPMAGGWLVSHLWEHYLFSGDTIFLAKELYPHLKGVVQFYKDWLTYTDQGYLVTPVSYSPELDFRINETETAAYSPGATMDMAIVREAYSRFIEAHQILGGSMDTKLADTIAMQLSKLQPYQIGKYGQLQEWLFDFEEQDPKHRHLSHLYGIYPGNQIRINSSPMLVNSVISALERRGEGGMGWSKTWKQGIWARLLKGEKAFNELGSLLHLITESKDGIQPGGTFPNLFCGPPFQIDGNFGATAGIAEMLIQSHAGEIHLLPGLPNAWRNGKVSGLMARGGFEIDMEWKDGRLTQVKIYSKLGGNCRVRIANEVRLVGEVQTRPASGDNPNQLFSYVDAGNPIDHSEGNYDDKTGFSRSSDGYCIDFETVSGGIYQLIP